MQRLIEAAKTQLKTNKPLPFSVYSSAKIQHLVNVPMIKPLLILVLSGSKELGDNSEIACPSGTFIFLSNSPQITLRNVPANEEYFAILIEFDYADFDGLARNLARKTTKTESYFQGQINTVLEQTLLQFIEWSAFSPQALWPIRRQEILQLLFHLGYEQVGAIMESPLLSHKLHGIISAHIADDLDATGLASMMAMSESTLRRKLNAEGTSLQQIKDRARLGYGLHLIQTTDDPIGRIAEVCGYQSQSRFTDRFKQHFGMTPSDLRKTRMLDSGE